MQWSALIRPQAVCAVLSRQDVLSGIMEACLCRRSGLLLIRPHRIKVALQDCFVSIKFIFPILFFTVKGPNLNAEPTSVPSLCCSHTWLFKWFPFHTLIFLHPPPFMSNFPVFFIPSSATPIFPVPCFISLSLSLSCNETHAERRLCN